MAHFFGFLKGARGEVTRLGHKSSGIVAEARGWSIGGRVEMEHDATHGDTVRLYVTGGSNGHVQTECVGVFRAVLVSGKWELIRATF